ncbi:hypothetical protein [Treponema primitia]|uniref:hypothetical protein n=1 Tax=Treponema primitia TaxID=88058 RepID=UPI00025553DB|nr:hypothetical protein [Treponema primitia]
MRSKLYAVFTGILCFCVVVACEIPQSVSVKGHPGVYLNLGSPFGSDNTLVDKFLNVDGLKDQLGGNNSTSRIYTYRGDINATGDDGVQTYLISFPLIPEFTVPSPYDAPIDIPLRDDKGSKFSGTIPNLALHEITNFLGGVSFDSVPAYLYVAGMTSGTMTLSYTISKQTTTLLSDAGIDGTNNFITTAFVEKGKNVKTWVDPLPADPTTDLNVAFNANSPVTLGFEIDGTVKTGASVKVDLVIKLPLKFSVPLKDKNNISQEVTFKNKAGINTTYVKLNLDALPKGDEDLFGRKGGSDKKEDDDDIFEQLDFVTILVNNIENTAIDNLFLGIQQKNQTISLNNNPDADYEIEFDDLELKPPFNPGFLVLVEKANNSIIIKPQADGTESKFDFKLALEAQADLNIQL